MSAFTDFLAFDFLRNAFLATLMLSIVSGLLSPLIIARRYSFLGSAVSHSTLLGVSIALALVGRENSLGIFAVTLLVTLVLTAILGQLSYRQKIPSDSLIGIFFTSTMGLGMIVHTVAAKGSGDLMGFLFGNILLLGVEDLLYCLGLLLIVLPVMLVPFKRWIYIAADEEGAELQGLNTRAYHFTFLALLTLLIVSSLKIAGSVVINTWLIAPGIFGLKVGRNIRQCFAYSLVFSLVFSLLGLVVANAYDLPTGPTLCVTQFVGLLGVFIFPRRT